VIKRRFTEAARIGGLSVSAVLIEAVDVLPDDAGK
jgi:hypothetical protein